MKRLCIHLSQEDLHPCGEKPRVFRRSQMSLEEDIRSRNLAEAHTARGRTRKMLPDALAVDSDILSSLRITGHEQSVRTDS